MIAGSTSPGKFNLCPFIPLEIGVLSGCTFPLGGVLWLRMGSGGSIGKLRALNGLPLLKRPSRVCVSVSLSVFNIYLFGTLVGSLTKDISAANLHYLLLCGNEPCLTCAPDWILQRELYSLCTYIYIQCSRNNRWAEGIAL